MVKPRIAAAEEAATVAAEGEGGTHIASVVLLRIVHEYLLSCRLEKAAKLVNRRLTAECAERGGGDAEEVPSLVEVYASYERGGWMRKRGEDAAGVGGAKEVLSEKAGRRETAAGAEGAATMGGDAKRRGRGVETSMTEPSQRTTEEGEEEGEEGEGGY
eukprot:GHVU01231026.1.p2 GENE.GHVU01231026.1~~GHVU01231026.1.p2  ORF type:complete len:159 (-),score=41.82 GHVU01231026.1:33-509(-)